MRNNCGTFNEWINSQAAEFGALQVRSDHLFATVWSTPLGGSVTCMIVNDRRNKTGFASVSAKKYEDPTKVAVGLAWADYKGEEIPDLSISLYELHTMDKFKYNGETYTYLTTNPCLPDNIIVCDSQGFPFNFNRNTKVRIKEV